MWCGGGDLVPPDGEAQHQQKSWDTLKVSALAESLLDNATDPDLVPVCLPLRPKSLEPG